jgi:AcrR family transcriptional regulator
MAETVRSAPAISYAERQQIARRAIALLRDAYNERTAPPVEGGLTVPQLAAETGWSPGILYRWFRSAPGVMVEVHPETLHRRRYTTLRIPRHVAVRVLNQHTRK